ncbi:MAG TPA: hypothetical protein VFY82_05480 [Acidimicrobiales bacterium]|nr:hypothetical protein [Acidimicrobiales bacterium]
MRGRRTRVALGVAATACLALGALAVRDWTATLDATDRTRAQTTEARVVLARTEGDLAAALESMDTADETLAAEAAALSARQAERAEAQGTADATRLWLSALQAQLASATTELEASTGRVTMLQTCLAGAAEALNQAAARDTAGAAATIRDIEGACAEAGVEM